MPFTDIILAIDPNKRPILPQKRRGPPPVNPRPNKRFRTDDEIINLLMRNGDSSSDSDEDQKDTLPCNNPLCDHKEFAKDEKRRVQKFRDIASIDDLIELGKTFHCKKNTMYYDINLRLLCNLVEPLSKLKNMVGMKSVKENMVNQIVFFLQGFNQKEKCGECLDCVYGLTCSKNLNDDMLHTIITGPPGVGKTELGKILGQVYKAMGILSKGSFHSVTRSDLIGKYLGHTAAKTQALIDKCRGGVLFIDEAYGLGNPEGRDSFSLECINTINQNLSERRDFLCIIAGYADALEKCFFQYNEGLKRRFTFKYDIAEYTSDELMEIFLMKVKLSDWKIEESSKPKLKDLFKKNRRHFPNFGGDIETFLLNCKVTHGKRVMHLTNEHKKILTIADLELGIKSLITNRNHDSDDDIQMIYNMN
jgi:hypothetical protein